jgi:hypothetical protein
MVIEPRRVAPGYARRWSRQALELMGRSFHSLFALALGMCGATWALEQAHLVLVTPFLLAWALGVAMEIVSVSDNHVLRMADLPSIFATAAREVVYEARTAARTILLIGVIATLAIGWSNMQPEAAVQKLAAPDLSNPLVWIFSDASPFTPASMMLILAASLQGYTVLDLAGLRQPLRREFGLEEEQVKLLLRQASQKNYRLAVEIALAARVLILVAIWAMPGLTPLLLCFLPALAYVAFREIFVDDKGNREPAKQTSTKLAMEGMPS